MTTIGSDGWFRAIAESAGDIIFIVNADGTVAYVNPFAARWIGKPADQIIGRRQEELFSPATGARQAATIRTVFESGAPFAAEEAVEVGSEQRFLDTRLTPLRGTDGRVTAVLGVSRDTTGSRRATEELRRSEERFRALVENSDEVIVINDATGKRLYVSASVERVFGYSPQEYLSQTVFDIAHPEDISRLHAVIRDANAALHVPMTITFRLRAKDGSERWAHAVVTNFSDIEPIGGLVINIHDITELRRAQDAQARASELERITKIMTGRELKMAELKDELERLRKDCEPYLTKKGA